MDEDQSLDNWIVNYESGQRHKHSQFLGTLKHEFIERTRQRRRDRANENNQAQIQGLQLQTSSRRGRTSTAHQRKKT